MTLFGEDPAPPKVKKTRAKKPDAAPTKALLTRFNEGHQARWKTNAAGLAVRDAAIASRLWKERVGDRITLEMVVDAYLASTDPYVLERGFSWPGLEKQMPRLLVQLSRDVSQRPRNCDCRPACRSEVAHTNKYLKGLK